MIKFKPFILFSLLLIIVLSNSVYGESFSETEKQLAVNVLSAIKGLDYDQALISSQLGDRPGKSATRYVWALLDMKDEIDPTLYKEILARPDMQKFYDTEHFRIHYDTSGALAVSPIDDILVEGLPDYVDSVALIFERVWAYEIDTLGYSDILDGGEPTSDGGSGGNSKYDIYITNVGELYYYGITYFDGINGQQSNPSYIEIDNNYTDAVFQALGYGDHPLDALKVTAAHEFFHALHYSLDSYETDQGRAWWQEVSAVWMEDKVFDEVNDYLTFIHYYYDFPYISLMEYAISGPNERVMHPYAACVWAKFIDERYGEDIVKDIWSVCAETFGYNTMAAHEAVFQYPAYGTTFEEAWQEFLVWNYYTGPRADSTVSFSEAHLWSDTLRPILVDSSFWGFTDSISYDLNGNNALPEPLGANYIYIDKSFSFARGGVEVTFQGEAPDDPRNQWRGQILGYDSINDRVEPLPISQSTHYGETIFRSWDQYAYLILIPNIYGLEYGEEGKSYSFTARYSPSYNDSVPVFNSIETDGYVQAGDCLEFYLSGYDPFGQPLTFRSSPPADSVDGLTIEAVDDTSAMVTYCPSYSLVDSVVSVFFYVDDPDSNYAVTYIDFNVTFFSATEDDPPVSIVGYPNPFFYGADDRVNFRVLIPDSMSASNTKLYVFTVAGDLVLEKTPDTADWSEIGENTIFWDGKNTNGHELAAGIYLVKLRVGDESADTKIAIIR